jgi:hypothetical protein
LIEALLRSLAAAETGRSLVDEMLGSAELRTVARGRVPLYDALRARHLARRRRERSRARPS